MCLAAGALRLKYLVFGGFVMKAWNVEHLPCLDNDCIGQPALTDIAVARRRVGFNVIHFRDLLQRMAGVPLLATRRILSRLALGFRLGPESIRGRWLAGVATVLRQASFKISDPRT